MATAARSAADDCLDESLKVRVEMIVRAAERMLRTTQRVLSLASAATPVGIGPVAPAPLFVEIAEDAGALGVPVTYRPDGSLSALVLQSDRSIIEAIVQSLLNNAQDHGEPGEPIRLAAVAADGALEVTVANTAAGKRLHSGLGAGTYLCQQLASRIGATLTTEATGCTFTAKLHVPA
jgi:signal transduction histidine kinase